MLVHCSMLFAFNLPTWWCQQSLCTQQQLDAGFGCEFADSNFLVLVSHAINSFSTPIVFWKCFMNHDIYFLTSRRYDTNKYKCRIDALVTFKMPQILANSSIREAWYAQCILDLYVKYVIFFYDWNSESQCTIWNICWKGQFIECWQESI